MDAKNRLSQSGAQATIDLARACKAALRVLHAAFTAGLHGALAATAKEALPVLVKLIVGLLAALLLLPLLIFIGMPNIFFGFENASAGNVADMTEKALAVGGIYMNMEELENAQKDAIVTSLVAQYEQDGMVIDEIEVAGHMDEDDLLWLIAILSVANRQDLAAMDAEKILELNRSALTCTSSLLPMISGAGESAVTTTTLRVNFERLAPEKIMDQLDFDDKERIWASALFEVMKESGSLRAYQESFKPDRPDYSGDSSYNGTYDRSDSYNDAIDISDFVSPDTKNNLDLVTYAIQAYENGWGYVWGTYGNVLTESLFAYKLEQYPQGVGDYEDFIKGNWLNRRTTDCVGLIKGYGWLNAESLSIDYSTNNMPDYSADQMHDAAEWYGTDYGTMETMPDVPGLAVWKSGHVGIYVGDGKVVEAMGTKYGVVMTELTARNWEGWFEIPFIEYREEKN